MAAPVTRCDRCSAVLAPEDILPDGRCAGCTDHDDPRDDDEVECSTCEERVPMDDVDEELECSSCRSERHAQRQEESDYRFWTR